MYVKRIPGCMGRSHVACDVGRPARSRNRCNEDGAHQGIVSESLVFPPFQPNVLFAYELHIVNVYLLVLDHFWGMKCGREDVDSLPGSARDTGSRMRPSFSRASM